MTVKTDRMYIRMSAKLKKAIQKQAKKDGKKPSEWVRIALERALS